MFSRRCTHADFPIGTNSTDSVRLPKAKRSRDAHAKPESLDSVNQISDPNHSTRHNTRPQSTSMDQSGEDALGGQAFEVLAGFTQTHPAQSHGSNSELASYQVIQRNTSRHYVSSCRSGRPFSQRWSGSLELATLSTVPSSTLLTQIAPSESAPGPKMIGRFPTYTLPVTLSV